MKDIITIVDYNNDWVELFERECVLLKAIFNNSIEIQHIGSTSINGLEAKPIIDIMIGVSELASIDQRQIKELEQSGYEFRGEAGIPNRFFFRKGMPRTHHLHVVKYNSDFWLEHLIFRDYLWLTENLVFLGEIERNNSFEGKTPLGQMLQDGSWEDDFLFDDSALVYMSNNGLVIITGCSHAGICNIIEYAKKVCSEERVYDVIGGFHLLNPSQHKLSNTVEYFKNCQPYAIHPCHCTDLHSKISLAQVTNVEDMGVGLVLEYK